jgi:hypothetical protein
MPMDRETEQLGLLQSLEARAQDFLSERRRVLAALLGIVGIAQLDALAVMAHEEPQPAAIVREIDCNDAACVAAISEVYAAGDRRYPIRATSASADSMPTTTTATTTTTTPTPITVPPLPVTPESQVMAASSAEHMVKPESVADQFIGRIPTLDYLAQRFPDDPRWQNVADQKAFIERMYQEVNVTVEDYEAFAVDQSFRGSFVGHPNYPTQITPRMFIIHWTAHRFPDGPPQLVDYMMKDSFTDEQGNVHHKDRTSVDYFMDRAGKTYQLFEDDHHMPAHARSANTFSQGVEIDATGLFDYTPEQVKSAVLLAVNFCRRNNLPVHPATIVSHYAANLLYADPYYDRDSGTLREDPGYADNIDKYDPPQEFITNLILKKAQELNHQLMMQGK